ncbi:MAG: threonine/serine dehydratase [Candidatus Krumholzibacteriota bacterium]|nr:threonine/serine dehydratase [Candidatus Krumholzibacteriota bacterium]
MDVFQEVGEAEKRIRPYIRETILERSRFYSQAGRAEVHLKLENLQYTGSFKARGAINKILSLTPAERSRGLVTASTGNHGAAVARSLEILSLNGIIFMPEKVPPSKLRMMERYGAEVRFRGRDAVEAEIQARRFAAERGWVYISPYNDPRIIGGQGTVGYELHHQLERIDAVFVSLGGGGLISGIAGYLKSVQPRARIIGCSPQNSPVMIESIKAGRIIQMDSLPTLSDGTAGGVEEGAITFELCRDLVDRYVALTEAEIGESLAEFIDTHHMLIEGAAAVAVAGYKKLKNDYAGRNVVIVICGANIGLEELQSLNR